VTLLRGYGVRHALMRSTRWLLSAVRKKIRYLKISVLPPNPVVLRRLRKLVARTPRLNVGCGAAGCAAGWINHDGRRLPNVDLVCHLARLPKYIPAGSMDEVFMSHVLEHLEKQEVGQLLQELYATLRPGGLLWLSVPDVPKIARLLALPERSKGEYERLVGPLVGGGANRYDYHRCAFSLPYLRLLLEETGFTDLRCWRSPPKGIRELPGDFRSSVDGDLISLNVLATRGECNSASDTRPWIMGWDKDLQV